MRIEMKGADINCVFTVDQLRVIVVHLCGMYNNKVLIQLRDALQLGESSSFSVSSEEAGNLGRLIQHTIVQGYMSGPAICRFCAVMFSANDSEQPVLVNLL